jgi:hypothetical protein
VAGKRAGGRSVRAIVFHVKVFYTDDLLLISLLYTRIRATGAAVLLFPTVLIEKKNFVC